MKKPIKIGGFKTQIWKACSKDHIRPALTHAFVRNGFIYATNAHIAVKQSLYHIHDLDTEQCEAIEGKYFSEHLLKQLEKCEIVQFKKDGVHTVFGNTKAVYQYSDCGNDQYPNVDAVLPAIDRIDQVSKIGLNPTYLKIISDVMMNNDNRFGLEFNGQNKAIVVTAFGYDREHQMGIIMPLMFND